MHMACGHCNGTLVVDSGEVYTAEPTATESHVAFSRAW